MIRLTLAEVARLTGGELVGDPGTEVTGAVAVDSREVAPGDLFVALPGEQADGAAFVPQAMAAGAVGALTSRADIAAGVVVADPLAALGRLASGVVERLPGLTVVGVTGSNGKTTTKDLLAHVLELLGPTVSPAGSFNNEVGMPRTVLRADESTRFLVLEYGARGVGHIAYLCGIARPDVAVELNVGSAHVGEFGSREAIAAAKSELVAGVSAEGLVVLNVDDPAVAAMATRAPAGARVVRFGTSEAADVRAVDVELGDDARCSFTLLVDGRSARVGLRLVGEHQVQNALAVAAVAAALGMELEPLAAALSSAEPRSRWRMSVTETPDGITVINDAYNANPESTFSALRSLARIGRGRRTWAVLGELRELGHEADAGHAAVGRLAAELGVDRLVVVGEPAREILTGAQQPPGWTGTAVFADTVEAAGDLLVEEIRSGDVVLVKASRAVGLEGLAESLERRSAP